MRPFTRLDLLYMLMVAACYATMIVAECVMPESPHRMDPAVQWAESLAQISAATAALLALVGFVEVLRCGFRQVPKLARIAWCAALFLPPFILLVSRSGGPHLYR